MERFLREIPIGRAKLYLGGCVTIRDSNGRETEHDAGQVWKPWEWEGKTIAIKNKIEIKGVPGPGIHYEICAFSISENEIGDRLTPVLIDVANKATTWKSKGSIAVFINGRLSSQSWVISHWTMFSDLTVFDAAMDKIETNEAPEKPKTIPVTQPAPAEVKTEIKIDLVPEPVETPVPVIEEPAPAKSRRKDNKKVELEDGKGKKHLKVVKKDEEINPDDNLEDEEQPKKTAPTDNEATDEEISKFKSQGGSLNGRLPLDSIRPS